MSVNTLNKNQIKGLIKIECIKITKEAKEAKGERTRRRKRERRRGLEGTEALREAGQAPGHVFNLGHGFAVKILMPDVAISC